MKTAAPTTQEIAIRPDAGMVSRFIAAVRGITPLIWRDFSIDAGDTLMHLHRTLQILFGWGDYHQFEFVVRGMEFPEVNDEFRIGIDPAGVALRNLELSIGETFLYRYDYGDGWEVELRVADVYERPALMVFPRCHEGGRAGPPEDCGGLGGYAELLRALSDPADKEHESLREWVGEHWDPESFDTRIATRMMAGLSRPSARKGKRGRSTDIPEPVRIAAEWLLASFCNDRSAFEAENPGSYDIELRKNAFTLFRFDHVVLPDGSPYVREERVARFMYLPESREWRLDWPNSLFTWRPAWHTPPVRDIGVLIRDVAQSEIERVGTA